MDLKIDQAVEVLSQTPSTLKSMLGGLSAPWTGSDKDRSDWSPYDVVGHLIHADKTDWVPRAEVILSPGEDRRFPPFDRFGQFDRGRDPSLTELLSEFAEVRSAAIHQLVSWRLTPEKLRLRGVHPEFGEVALEQLIATWVVHDLTHIRQIVTWMARRYEDAVGPWRSYLSILQ